MMDASLGGVHWCAMRMCDSADVSQRQLAVLHTLLLHTQGPRLQYHCSNCCSGSIPMRDLLPWQQVLLTVQPMQHSMHSMAGVSIHHDAIRATCTTWDGMCMEKEGGGG